jgi:type III secretory pathway component EscU
MSPPGHFSAVWGKSLKRRPLPHTPIPLYTLFRAGTKCRAGQNQVPIVENPPLARALYSSVDVGKEIPAELYRAVAEILAYIYKLMGGRLPG